MSEWIETDGKRRLSLPVSVSPEFKGTHGSPGRFVIPAAAFHLMAQLLPQAAAALGEAVDERWQQVQNHSRHTRL